MADGRSYERGEGYAVEGRVSAFSTDGTTATAKVRGGRIYRVAFRAVGGKFDYSCSCPVGEDGDFCKHCVAVGLVFLKAPVREPGEPAAGLKDVRAYLAGQDKDALVDLLMRRAREDGSLRRRLVLAAAKTPSKGVDLRAYRQAVDESVDEEGLGSDSGEYEWAQGVGEAVEGIRSLLKEGHASEAVELSEYALRKIEPLMEQVYDEGTDLSGLLEDLQEIHFTACRKARPDPRDLARRLFDWELNGQWGVFDGAARKYKDILGKDGLEAFRKLAEAVWADVPVLSPGDRESGGRIGRERITGMMEDLTRAENNVDGMIAVMSKDLSVAHDYLEIALLCRKEGRADQA
ncbi:MAG: SWIM zinc finger family protein, partial [bacterium]